MIDPHLDLEIAGRGIGADGKGSYLVQRNAHVIVVQVAGEIVDEVSDAWRACCQRSFDEHGYPTFGYVDATRAVMAQSLGTRMRSASFMRQSAQRLRRIVLVSEQAETGFVLRTVMRAAGVSNVHRVEPATAISALALMREGTDPLGAGVL